MRYPGGKGKTFQHVINLMPPHRVYVETHIGGGAVMRHKAPAQLNFALDIDPKVIDAWEAEERPDVRALCVRAEEFLAQYEFQGDELLYMDPPYHPATRLQARVYNFDYSASDHERLLDLVIGLPCMVILSGYDNPLYAERLAGWNKTTFNAKTHVDVRVETLWFNFEPPTELHDDRYRGTTFRERQTNQRRLKRLQDKVRSMEPVERAAFTRWLNESYPNSRSSAP